MTVALVAAIVWTAIALPAGIVLGRGIRLADREQERQHTIHH